MRYLRNPFRFITHIIVIPIIVSPVIPIIILDIWAEIYHRVCFPLCGMSYIERKKYIKFDRHKLKYLTWFQKIGCVYCGYVNGLVAYWVKMVGETEKYWCGIKHKKNSEFIEPAHHKNFAKYNDEEDFKNKYKN